MRQARIKSFAAFAQNLAVQSKCKEKQVAAVITDKDMTQVYSIGLNGGPKGLVDCMCALEGKYGCVHAEINALIKCRSDAPDKVMFVTLSPCISCAAAIINAPGSFSAVYYLEEWKNTEGLKLLKQAGIKVMQVHA
jgi:deoxycytidylate deaminase